mgnify:CR=1 FL=1
MATEGIKRESLLEKAELYIYLSTAAVLVFAAAGLLVAAVFEMIQVALQGNYVRALLQLLDRALLVLMMAEIIYTVGRIAKRMRIEIQPFLIVGIIAAVRRMLVITAESAEHVDLSDPTFQAALAELALLGLLILALAWSMRLVPAKALDDR